MSLEAILANPDRLAAYYDLVALFISGNEYDRLNIITLWDFGVVWQYPNQFRLACAVGETRPCRERIVASLAYQAIAAAESTYTSREDIMDLAIIHNSCRLADLDAEAIFRQVAAIAVDRIAKTLNDFRQRRPEDKSMEAFGLKAVKNADGEMEIVPPWMNDFPTG